MRLAPTTSSRYSQYLHNQVLPFFTGWPIASIDYQDVEEFIGHLFDEDEQAEAQRFQPRVSATPCPSCRR